MFCITKIYFLRYFYIIGLRIFNVGNLIFRRQTNSKQSGLYTLGAHVFSRSVLSCLWCRRVSCEQRQDRTLRIKTCAQPLCLYSLMCAHPPVLELSYLVFSCEYSLPLAPLLQPPTPLPHKFILVNML